MTKKDLIFLVLLSCVVGHASVKYNHLIEEGVVPMEEYDALQCRVRHMLEGALGDQTSVWVVLLSCGERYTASYDVSEECCGWLWRNSRAGKEVRMIFPMMDYIKHEVLRGYENHRLCEQQTDFSEEFKCVGGSLDKARYQRCVFFSKNLREFFTLLCPRLQQKGKVTWDSCGKRLVDVVLQSVEPPLCNRLSFVVQDKESALSEILSAKKEDAMKVFMTLPGFGVVKGCAVPRESLPYRETVLSPHCFFVHKINAVIDAMSAHYPFDEEVWKTCINYRISRAR